MRLEWVVDAANMQARAVDDAYQLGPVHYLGT